MVHGAPFPVTNEHGTIPRDLDVYKRANYADITATNPYYNAMLPSENRSKILSVTNNTNLNWYIIDNLRWTASMSLNTTNTDNIIPNKVNIPHRNPEVGVIP